MKQLSEETLAQSATVANNRMNRLRGLLGINSYQKELKTHIPNSLLALAEAGKQIAWLDVGCGIGKALIEAGKFLSTNYPSLQLHLEGIDLVDNFLPLPENLDNVHFKAQAAHLWQPTQHYDLITAVHSFHYFGDKLAILQKLLACLSPKGLFMGQVDLSSVYIDEFSQEKMFASYLRKEGLKYNTKNKLLISEEQKKITFPYQYLYADDEAGKNYTGQEAVRSYYTPSP